MTTLRDELLEMLAKGAMADRYFDRDWKAVCAWDADARGYVYPDGDVVSAFMIRDDLKKQKKNRRFQDAPMLEMQGALI